MHVAATMGKRITLAVFPTLCLVSLIRLHDSSAQQQRRQQQQQQQQSESYSFMLKPGLDLARLQRLNQLASKMIRAEVHMPASIFVFSCCLSSR